MTAVSQRALGHTPREPEWVSLLLIGALLTGYALFSKGFAYLGRPPIFIGEIVLAACLVLFLVRPNFHLLRSSPIAWLIVAFWALCLLRTVPYLQTYGPLNALRDSVIYGYSAFALLIGTLMARQDRIGRLLPAFAVASSIVVILSPFVILSLRPLLPGAVHIPLIYQKAGDLSVHLVGAAAFRLVMMPAGGGTPHAFGLRRLLDLAFWLCWLFCAAWAASVSRGALLTIATGAVIVFAMGYGRRVIFLAGIGIVALAIILGALQLTIVQSGPRQISTNQILANTLSIVSGDTLQGDRQVDVRTLQSNTQWRLKWWSKIVDETIFGDGFWGGRGFGANLATLDGFQVDTRQSLRSPHSIHMTILARVGVPGLVLWLTLLGTMIAALLNQARRMKARGFHQWRSLNIWILAYWSATIVNGSFDVYFEGPQGGIWAWSLMGLGLAVIEIEKRAGVAASVKTHGFDSVDSATN